jgi:hypothetical protein
MFAEDEPRPASRLASGAVAVVYVVGAVALEGPVSGLRMFAFCLIPLGCIWFPEALGDYVGGNMNAPSPPFLGFILGWSVLLLPMVAGLLIWLRT